MDNINNQLQLDSVVSSVIDKIKSRANIGFHKYGTNMDRNDLSLIEWINHCQEELMDAMIYFEKIKKTINEKQ